MSDSQENNTNIPIVRSLIKLSRRIKLPGFEGLSVFDLLEMYGRGIVNGAFSSRASSIAFSFFVALFPFLLFMLNLIPIIPIDGFQTTFIDFIEELLPPQTAEYFYPIIADIAVNSRGGGLLSFVFFLSLFLAANGVNAIFSAFEYSYYTTVNRGFIKQYLVAVGVSLLLALLLLFTVGVILYGEYAISQLKDYDYIINDLGWNATIQLTIFVIMLYVIISTLYYFGTKESKESNFFSVGALVTTLMFLLTTYFFGIYINNFSTYNELYGSIGALLIMLLYIWINANLLLLGFELNISLHRLKDKC